jgi:succinyl-CoA:acetate CoA-transferase
VSVPEERVADGLAVVDAEAAAEVVPEEATLVTSGFGSVGYPKAVPAALARSGRELSLTVVSGGSAGEAIDVDLVEAGAVERRIPYQAERPAREAINDGEIAFHDRHIAALGDDVAYGGLVDADLAVVEAVAVGEDWFVPAMSVGPVPAFVRAADRLIVEVNDVPPLALARLHDIHRREPPPDREPIPLSEPGERVADAKVRFDPGKLAAVVRTSRADKAYSFRDPTADDRAIAANLGDFLAREVERNPILADRITLQFGVGSLGNALMGELSGMEFGDREVVYFGELIQDGLVEMVDEGALTVASATAMAVTPECQRRVFDDVERYAERMVLRPSFVSNAAETVDRFGVVGVNSALEVDVYGNANSTHVNGSHLLNGIGGSGDFNRNSPLAITALPSTAKGGEISRVVPMVPHPDHTEHDIDVIITEQGVADLRGLDPRERAELLVAECAHPDVRPALRSYLERAEAGGGHVPHDLETAFDWR